MKKKLFILCLMLFFCLVNIPQSFAKNTNIDRVKIERKQKIKELKQIEKERRLQAKKELQNIKDEPKRIKLQAKKEQKELKAKEKQAKIDAKNKAKADKLAKKQAEKDAEKQAAADKKAQKQLEKEQRLAKKQIEKEQSVKDDTAKALKNQNTAQTDKIQDNPKKITKETVDKAFDETNIKPVSNTDEKEDEKQDIKTIQTDTKLYRKNLTFEDIDKNAVSINEFLQFTDEQNEKFSVFYYKTTSKLTSYTNRIKNLEEQMKELRSTDLDIKTQYEKLKKTDKELDILLKERDAFYNKSLEKFNSLLNKKQKLKWEILREMGYRFIPAYD